MGVFFFAAFVGGIEGPGASPGPWVSQAMGITGHAQKGGGFGQMHGLEAILPKRGVGLVRCTDWRQQLLDACTCEGVAPATMISAVSVQAPMPAHVKGRRLLR